MKPDKENNKKDFPDLTDYPASEDIFNVDKEETEIDPEDISQVKTYDKNPGKSNEKDFEDDKSGNDLDIPGSELDDEMEEIGSEDEENNYYSNSDNNEETDSED
jgi:hypothetical protein